MTKEVRRIDEKNINEMFDLAAYAFNAATTDERKERFRQVVSHSSNYGYFVEDTLTSQLISTPFTVAFHGTNYQMAGIGCVSSYPEYRGQGSISAIMKQLLTELAEQHVELAYLAPFSYPFYRKYGFEQLFERIEYTVAAADWPNVKSVPGKMKRVTYAEAKDECQKIYSVLPTNQRGAVIREAWWLEYTFGLDQENQFALYEDEHGKIQGYLIYQSSADCFVIKEWGYLTNHAFRAMVRFVGSHNGASRIFQLKTGFGGKELSYLMASPQVEMKLMPDMMGRIVDVASFLANYPFTTGNNESYYFDVKDEYGSWNQGILEVRVTEQGQGTARKLEQLPDTQSAETLIHCSIQSLTQLFMGYKTGTELNFYGKIIGSKNQVQALDQRLVKGVPVLEDYF